MADEHTRGFNFEKLDVWHRAAELAPFVHEGTGKFSPDEKFGLTSQMRRPVASVSSTIAGGSSRSPRADFARFLGLAVGSLYELVGQTFVAGPRGFLGGEAFQKICDTAGEVIRMSGGLRNHLRG